MPRDQYVRCTHRTYGDPVYRDSCVEFFIQPKPGRGYFNFEFNCGGAFLCNYRLLSFPRGCGNTPGA